MKRTIIVLLIVIVVVALLFILFGFGIRGEQESKEAGIGWLGVDSLYLSVVARGMRFEVAVRGEHIVASLVRSGISGYLEVRGDTCIVGGSARECGLARNVRAVLAGEVRMLRDLYGEASLTDTVYGKARYVEADLGRLCARYLFEEARKADAQDLLEQLLAVNDVHVPARIYYLDDMVIVKIDTLGMTATYMPYREVHPPQDARPTTLWPTPCIVALHIR